MGGSVLPSNQPSPHDGLFKCSNQVRDELVQLLDDDEDMADLYLSRKLLQSQNLDSPFLTSHLDDRNSSSLVSRKLARLSSIQSHGPTSRRSSGTHTTGTGYDVEDLEMLLEAYFMQVDASLNKLFMVSFFTNLVIHFRGFVVASKTHKSCQVPCQLNVKGALLALQGLYATV